MFQSILIDTYVQNLMVFSVFYLWGEKKNKLCFWSHYFHTPSENADQNFYIEKKN